MARFINPFSQYILSTGSPNAGGILRFFDTGTENPKDVFSDPELNTAIGSEIRLDLSGRIPDIWLNGVYRLRLYTSDGVTQLAQADPIGIDTTNLPFELWLPSNVYNIPDIVKGSDNRLYRSLSDSNQGNDPTTQPSAFWEEILFFPVWNNAGVYRQGELVIASNGRTYQSQTGANTGNDPTLDDGSNWKQLLQGGDTADFVAVSITKEDDATTGIGFISDNFLRWQWNFDASENLKLNRHDGAGALIDTPIEFDVATGDTTITSNITANGDVLIQGQAVVETGASDNFLNVSSNAGQTAATAYRDAGVDRWIIGQTLANNFSLSRFNASGILQGTPFFFTEDDDNINLEGNINFTLTNLELDCTSPNGGTISFNFSGADTENVAFEFFNNTNTTGTRTIQIFRGDGTTDVTCEINAEDGSIHPAKDREGTGAPGVKLGKIILSDAAPSGGEDGDLWLRY